MNIRMLILFSVMVETTLSGCTQVAPWERGNLAKESMAINPHPNLSNFREHIFSSKEASQGGHTSSGGGCGCN